MSDKAPFYNSLAKALVSIAGSQVSIAQTDRLSGGDINKAYALTLNNGERIFMKANSKANLSFFFSESAGISAIASTNTIQTPEILCLGSDDGEEVGYSFMFMKFLESGKATSDYWHTFGHELALMHKSPADKFVSGGKFGFLEDNFIGSRPQVNTACDSWISFFRDYRLAPQFKAADKNFDKGDRDKITALLDHLDKFLVEPEKPSLLHGDLWSGNVMCGPDGKAWLIDPAVYVGHAEADIAMTELFGSFPDDFYAGYKETAPLEAGYAERRDLYNLYHLLNHLNMFGASYLSAVKSIIDEYS